MRSNTKNELIFNIHKNEPAVVRTRDELKMASISWSSGSQTWWNHPFVGDFERQGAKSTKGAIGDRNNTNVVKTLNHSSIIQLTSVIDQ